MYTRDVTFKHRAPELQGSCVKNAPDPINLPFVRMLTDVNAALWESRTFTNSYT